MKHKILFSWLAVFNDFDKKGDINNYGPTVNTHAFHWGYHRHYILYTPDYEGAASKMQNYLWQHFPSHHVNIIPVDIQNPYTDLSEILVKIKDILIQYANFDIDLLLSTGTGVMKIAWYIAHSIFKFNTRLVLVLPPAKKEGKDELFPDIVVIDANKLPVATLYALFSLNLDVEKTRAISSNFLSLYHHYL